jgi:hypothetical protein
LIEQEIDMIDMAKEAKKSAGKHRAVTNAAMLRAISKFIRKDSDGGVFAAKDIGKYKKGEALPLVSVKGADLISTSPKVNLSWQKKNAKTVTSLFNAVRKSQ